MSARDNLLVALRTALSGLCDGRVYRSRLDQLPVLPAIIITPESETDTGDMLGCTDATLTVAISIYASADIPDQAIDPILAAVLAALRTDSTLGLGSDVQIQPSRRIDWDIQNYDDGAATLHIDITYRTY